MNTEKSLRRELTRLRKTQNPSAIDLRRIRRLSRAKTKFWRLRKKTHPSEVTEPEKKKTEKKREAKHVKEDLPEEEMIEEELPEEKTDGE